MYIESNVIVGISMLIFHGNVHFEAARALKSGFEKLWPVRKLLLSLFEPRASATPDGLNFFQFSQNLYDRPE